MEEFHCNGRFQVADDRGGSVCCPKLTTRQSQSEGVWGGLWLLEEFCGLVGGGGGRGMGSAHQKLRTRQSQSEGERRGVGVVSCGGVPM